MWLRATGRMEGPLGDLVVPAAGVVAVFVMALVVGLADLDTATGAREWAPSLQGTSLLAQGLRPIVTVAEGQHLVAERLALVWIPVGFAARVADVGTVLVTVQALALAAGIVPLWRLVRIDASLRVGAATALLVVYALTPVVGGLVVDGFHPEVVALPGLLWAAHLGLHRSPLVWIAVAVTLAARADLGVAVAGLGLGLMLVGRPRPGGPLIAVGLGWWALAVTVLQPWLADGAAASSDFARFGSSPWEIAAGLLGSPDELFGVLVGQPAINVVLATLGPVLFLPILAPRLIIGAVPIQALYLLAEPVGEVSLVVAVPLAAFAFIATPFALNRLGQTGTQRVRVDRRLLVALVAGAMVFFLALSPASPYAQRWSSNPGGSGAGPQVAEMGVVAGGR